LLVEDGQRDYTHVSSSARQGWDPGPSGGSLIVPRDRLDGTTKAPGVTIKYLKNTLFLQWRINVRQEVTKMPCEL
jgi:hypothetical protein